MNTRHEIELDEAQLVVLAQRFAASLADGGVIHLRGELGAGKTTFARALLGALGVGARIKSPTYSLVESYVVGDLHIHHLDLYRIAAADELEFLGLTDLATGRFLLLVEWPERGGDALPRADLALRLEHAGAKRRLRIEPSSPRARSWIAALGEERVP